MSKHRKRARAAGPAAAPAPASTLPLDFPVFLGEVTDGVTVQDAAGRLLYANPAAARASGFDSVDDMLNAPPATALERFELFDESGRRFPADQLPGRRALLGEPGGEVTLRFRRTGTAEERWSMLRALPILEADGRVRAVVNLIRDVTAEKTAEITHRESERRFRVMADTAPVLIWSAGPHGGSDFFNRPWREFTGRTLQEELGDGWAAGVHPDDLGACLQTYRAAFAARTPFRQEYRLRRADGEYRWLLDTGVPRFAEDGEFCGFVGSCIDITERRRNEEALRFLARASEALSGPLDFNRRLARVAQLAVPAIADWCAVDLADPEGALRRLAVAHDDPERVRWANEIHRRYPPRPDAAAGAYSVLRTGRSELHTLIPDSLLVRVAQDAEHLELLRSVGFASAMIVPLVVDSRVLGVVTLAAAESGRRYDEADLRLAEDLARRAATALDNARLFAEVERSREALERQAAELEAIAAELEATNEELVQRTTDAETANRAKAEFLAVMSHELRTPLNAIAGYVDLLLMGVHGTLDDQQKQDLQRIRSSQVQLLAIIDEVLSFARIENGQVEYAVGETPVGLILTGLADSFGPEIDAKSIEYLCQDAPRGLTARADADRARQILLNLLGNALKFTPPGGRIEVVPRSVGDSIEIHVRDTGRGIPRDRLDSVFEPFVQLEPPLTRDHSGIGLGLAISRDLARGMGGDLRAESAPGSGAALVLTLPRGRDVVPP